MPPAQQQAAYDAAAAVSVTAAGWTWLSHANEILTFIATLVAIAAGVCSAWFHIERSRALYVYRRLAEREKNINDRLTALEQHQRGNG